MQARQKKIIILQLFSQLIRIKSAFLLGSLQNKSSYFYSYFFNKCFLICVCVCGK